MLKNKIIKIYSLFIIVILLVGFSIPLFIGAEEDTVYYPITGQPTKKSINTISDSKTTTDSIDTATNRFVYKPLEQLPGVKTDNLGVYLGGMFELAIGIATVLAVLMIVIGGFKYMTAEASPYSVEEAKEQIKGALIGLVLVLASWLILNTINTDLVNFNTNLNPVKITPNKNTGKKPLSLQINEKKENLNEIKKVPISTDDKNLIERLEEKDIIKGNQIDIEKLEELYLYDDGITLDEIKSLLKDGNQIDPFFNESLKDLHIRLENEKQI